MNEFEKLAIAQTILKDSKPKYDFSGFKVLENSMMPKNEIWIVCGSEIYKQVVTLPPAHDEDEKDG